MGVVRGCPESAPERYLFCHPPLVSRFREQYLVNLYVMPGAGSGNHPASARNRPGYLFSKRLLHVIKFSFTLRALMGQSVRLAFCPFFLVGHGLDALVCVGWLRTIRHVHVLRIFINHFGFTPQHFDAHPPTPDVHPSLAIRSVDWSPPRARTTALNPSPSASDRDSPHRSAHSADCIHRSIQSCPSSSTHETRAPSPHP